MGAVALVGATAAVSALWAPGVVLGPAQWLAVVGLSVPAATSWVVPVAAAVAVVGALGRWVDSGAWTGLVASGTGGRHLLPGAVVVGVVACGLCAAGTLWGEPLARRHAARVVRDGAASVELWPGQVVWMGDVALQVDALSDDGWSGVRVGLADQVITARRGWLVRRGDALALQLEDGEATGLASRPWHATFDAWSLDLPAPAAARVELAERATSDLAGAAARTEAAGRDASYEWSVLYKRFAHPVAGLVLPLAALPLATSRRRWLSLLGLGLGYVLAVRLGDHGAAWVGGLAASLSGPLVVALAGVLAWTRWGTR